MILKEVFQDVNVSVIKIYTMLRNSSTSNKTFSKNGIGEEDISFL